MADTNGRWPAMKTALLILLPILNAIQLYIIVTTNSDSVNELLREYLHTKYAEGLFQRWGSTGSEEPNATAVPVQKLYPRPEEGDVKLENVTIKWSRSADRLQYLAKHELSLYQMMKDYKLEIQTKLNAVTSWIEDYESTSLKATQHLENTNTAKITEEIASHPFLASGMLRRFAGLKELVDRAVNEPVIEGIAKLIENETAHALPDTSDYEDALWNIINLRYVYGLNVTDLINGKFKDTQTPIGLTHENAYDIANVAEKSVAYSEAFYWYDTILENLKLEDPNSIRVTKIELDIERIKVKHDELRAAVTDETYWDHPHRFVMKMATTAKENLRTVKQNILEKWHNGKQSKYSEYQYHEMCSGQSYLTELEESRLTCFYDKKNHPYWLLRPLKVEVYSWDPYLIRIHDVVTESMIEYLLASARNQLEPAEVVNEDYNQTNKDSILSVSSKARVGLYTFLGAKSTRLKNLYESIGHMVGLKCEYDPDHYPSNQRPISAEDMQIANYAFGGHYEYHHDYLGDNHILDLEGNRIATFMIYLNNVTSGGPTAFPRVGVSVKPIRNTAVFWYNLRRNGEGDERTLHGGCPVILGQKWISNVWIHSFASFLHRKCSLNPEE